MIRSEQKGHSLTVYLNGEIDHCAAEVLRGRLENLIRKSDIDVLMLNLENVTFMDSSGVGMLIGRYKTMKDLGGQVYACGLHTTILRLYKMAGLHRIIPIIDDERSMQA